MALSDVSEGLRENNISLQEIKEEIINLQGKLSSSGGGGFNLPKFLNPMKMIGNLTDSLIKNNPVSKAIRGVRNSMKGISDSIKAPFKVMSKLFGNMFEMMKSPNFDGLIDKLIPALKPLFEPIYKLLKPNLDDLEASRENRTQSNNQTSESSLSQLDQRRSARIPGLNVIKGILGSLLGLKFLAGIKILAPMVLAGIGVGIKGLFSVLGMLATPLKFILPALRMLMGPLGIALMVAIPLLIGFFNSETFKNLKTYVVETMVPAIENFYNDWILPFTEKLKAGFFKTWENISNGYTLIKDKLTNFYDNKILPFTDKLRDGFFKAQESISNGYTNIKDKLTEFKDDKLLPFGKVLEDGFFKAWNGISTFFGTEIGPAFDNISVKNGPLLTALAGDLGDAFDALVSGDFATFGDKMAAVGTNSLTVIDNTATEIFNAVARSFGFSEVDSIGFAISSFFSNVVAEVVTFIDSTLETLGFDTTVKDMIASFRNTVDSTFDMIENALTFTAHLFTNIPEIGSAAMEVAKATVSLKIIKIQNVFESLFDFVLNAFSDFADQIKIAAFKSLNLTIPSFQFTIDLPGFDPVTAGFQGFSAGLDTSGAKARAVKSEMTDRVIEVNQNRVNRAAEEEAALTRLSEAKAALSEAITPPQPVIIQNGGDQHKSDVTILNSQDLDAQDTRDILQGLGN